jgi:PTH1 family peptidyl-tRNA hydrolase
MEPPCRRLFIASIGNIQKPYRNTRHSAGHLLLDAIAPQLPARLSAAANPFYQTWYSPSYMNVSGPKLVRQLQNFTQQANATATTLVILHDELESPLGKVRVKRGGPEVASLRGHRGLISVFESLRGKGLYPVRAQQGGLSVLRVGIGIGRPETREKGAVADYVLTAMSPTELAAVHRAAGPVVELIAEEMYRTDGGSS